MNVRPIGIQRIAKALVGIRAADTQFIRRQSHLFGEDRVGSRASGGASNQVLVLVAEQIDLGPQALQVLN